MGPKIVVFSNKTSEINEICAKAVGPDGKRGQGLFPYLRRLTSNNGDNRRDVIATVFKGSFHISGLDDTVFDCYGPNSRTPCAAAEDLLRLDPVGFLEKDPSSQFPHARRLMINQKLGRLTKVDLREGWASESSDFTPWLAREDNLALLGDAIGIELELDAQEQEVGPFRADILCRDTANDSWVLIENQLERTDHNHLGQLLTYAAGLEAVTIVWVAERFTSEHRAALDWLNEHTDEKINFFGLEVELWRIGDSAIAPKFNVVSQPNDWSRTVQQAAAAGGAITETKQLQLRFWTAFRDHMEQSGTFIRCQKPLPQHWMNHAIGRTGVHLASIMSTWNSATNAKGSEVRVDLYIDGPSAKQEFEALEKQKDAIEHSLGFTLTWRNPADKAACRLYVRQDADVLNERLWPEQFEWLRQRLETMHRVFGPLVRQLRNDGV